MAPQSKRSQQIRLQQLQKLQKCTPQKINAEMLYAIQNNHDDARVYIRDLFHRFDINKDGFLQLEELHRLHKTLTADLGLRPLSDADIKEHFLECDMNDDSRLSFEEFQFYLREQVLEAMFRLEEGHEGIHSPLA
eukprot:gene31635-24270_t